MALISEDKVISKTDGWVLLAPTGQTTVSVSLNGTGRATIKAIQSGDDIAVGGGGHVIMWGQAGTPSAVSFNGLPADCEVYGQAIGTASSTLSVTSW